MDVPAQEFSIWWLIGPMFVGMILFIGIFTAVIGQNQLGTTAGKRQTKQVLALIVPLFLVIGLAAWWFEGSDLLFWILPAVVVFTVVIVLAQRWRQPKGQLLVNLGNQRERMVLVILGGITIVACLASVGLGVATPNRQAQSIVFPIALIAQNIFLVWRATWKNELRQHGLMLNGTFIRWNNMQGYYWEADRPTTRTIQLKKPRLWLRTVSFPIPPQHRDTVERLFAERVPRAMPSSSSLAM